MRLLFVATLCLAACEAYKMVLIAPDMAKSQVIFNKRVAETLAAAGHDVTLVLISSLNDNDISQVKISEAVKVHRVNASAGITKEEMDSIQSEAIFKDVPIWHLLKHGNRLNMMMSMLAGTCRNMVRNTEFINWLRDSQFDLAFVHIYHPCPVGLVHAAGIPSWVWLNSGQLMDFVANTVGVPSVPSYVPPMPMESTDEMGFFKRIKSFMGHGLTKFIWKRMSADPETAIFREQFGPDFPDLVELASKCPLVMVNSNELYELPRPTLAKVVSIGGIGVQQKDAKPLAQQFASLVSKGKGSVVMSFGSVTPAHKMPEEWKNALLAAFKRLPEYQFIVRYEKDDLNDKLPSNVHLFKWLPQSDLLQHDSVKAFISHGGYNSLQETITAGKPLITLALFGDQPKNAQIAFKHGISLPLSKSNMTEHSVYEAVSNILNNLSFTQKAQRMRDMVRKRPISAEMLLVRWAEFAAEFKSLENLQPAGQKLNFIQYHSIDVMLTLAGVIFVVFFLVYKIVKCVVVRLCCISRSKPKLE